MSLPENSTGPLCERDPDRESVWCAYHHTEHPADERPEVTVTMTITDSRDYQPRTRPLVPVGHETWCAVSRVPGHSRIGEGASADEQIEWFLRAITAPGADSSQRRYDLEQLAAIVTRNPSAGYGVAPIDSDTHDHECIVCGEAAEYAQGGHDADFDIHPYTMKKG